VLHENFHRVATTPKCGTLKKSGPDWYLEEILRQLVDIGG
jgi:hypothetical protein